MATWTDITDAALEPGKPARSVDALALRDNTQFVKDTHGYQVFTASGTFTPPAGITSYRVIIIGAGGGAGRGVYSGNGNTVGGSGGSGGAIETVVSNQNQLSYAVIVGVGGAGGSASGNGGAGGDSSVFGLTVGGGGGGINAANRSASNLNGAAGSTPAAMIRGNASTPRLSIGYGTGGAGGAGGYGNNNGAAGKAGVVIIEW